MEREERSGERGGERDHTSTDFIAKCPGAENSSQVSKMNSGGSSP